MQLYGPRIAKSMNTFQSCNEASNDGMDTAEEIKIATKDEFSTTAMSSFSVIR